MTITERLDPELATMIEAAPAEGIFDWNDLEGTRKFFLEVVAKIRGDTPDSENVLKEDLSVPGPEGDPEVPVRIYRPKEQSSGSLPGLLWMPGGGYVIGNIEQDDLAMQHIVEEVGCVVVSGVPAGAGASVSSTLGRLLRGFKVDGGEQRPERRRPGACGYRRRQRRRRAVRGPRPAGTRPR